MNFSIQGELQLFAEELYQHLTPSFLEKLAREIAFVQRKRKFSGHDLACSFLRIHSILRVFPFI
ncbi:hypothetical protein [Bacillus paramycoides]|uniref:hypothetical protein n=1 Tax=Bacillus paramycoides TaxID=2026194 RepID=UPI003CFE117A